MWSIKRNVGKHLKPKEDAQDVLRERNQVTALSDPGPAKTVRSCLQVKEGKYTLMLTRVVSGVQGFGSCASFLVLFHFSTIIFNFDKYNINFTVGVQGRRLERLIARPGRAGARWPQVPASDHGPGVRRRPKRTPGGAVPLRGLQAAA